ncbi:MAG: hypothetical protein Q8J74_08100, partial [Candidatus Didemnitutus sp.]|nr:hypothetical protein [Candidatus Didemnitutus sp.]
MSAPFRRPVLATLFYVLAGLFAVLSVISILLGVGVFSKYFPLGFATAYGAAYLVIFACQALV